MAHKHAELMKQYADDAARYDEPWRYWQVKFDGRWDDCLDHPSWWASEYRRKPKTININGHEVPEPMMVKPDVDEVYYFASPCEKELWDFRSWQDYDIDNSYFNRGLCHSTKEAAIAHAEALLSFTCIDE